MDGVIRRFRVCGKVQGVSFRYSAQFEAKRLSIRGFARNLPDGCVEVLAQGSSQALDELRLWLHRGPRHARVETVQEGDADDFDGRVPVDFEIR